jgi:hypothetical protein
MATAGAKFGVNCVAFPCRPLPAAAITRSTNTGDAPVLAAVIGENIQAENFRGVRAAADGSGCCPMIFAAVNVSFQD